ncbi:MAG: hypothetical protein HGA59_06680 [Chlorobiaceae bacterium]|nr:hypothetical protein [Chlorobiaceae bacterium]
MVSTRGRVEALRRFIASRTAYGARYNFSGVVQFIQRKKDYDQTLSEQLYSFFNEEFSPSSPIKRKYFCSELVVDCFVAIGHILPRAAVLYNSKVISPGALGRDPTFGTFYGYVTCVADYKVPETDEFFYKTTFNEIFGDEL